MKGFVPKVFITCIKKQYFKNINRPKYTTNKTNSLKTLIYIPQRLNIQYLPFLRSGGERLSWRRTGKGRPEIIYFLNQGKKASKDPSYVIHYNKPKDGERNVA